MWEYLSNLKFDTFTIIKIFVALGGFMALIARIRDSFSSYNERQKIKVDLEILELSEKQGIKNKALREKIEKQIDYQYNEDQYIYFDKGFFLFGLTLFVCFGLWAADVLGTDATFSWSAIVYILISGAGLTLMVKGEKGQEKKEDIFFRVLFYNKFNFLWGLFLSIGGITCSIVFFRFGENTWATVSVITGVWALWTIAKHTKLKREKVRKAPENNTV